jgi:hypothetical protein
MADPVTLSDVLALSQEHGDIRREAEASTGTIRRESAEHASDIRLEAADQTGTIRREAATQIGNSRVEAATQNGTARYEAAMQTNEIVKEGLKESFAARGDIKDTRYDLFTRINDAEKTITSTAHADFHAAQNHMITLSRESADNRAQILGLGYQVRDGFVAAVKDNEINALKTQVEIAKQSTYLSDKINQDGDKTRALVASLKEAELNRLLIERNSEIVEERHGRRHYQHENDFNRSQGQWAAVHSQLQAFGSTLQDTRNGLYNFGTMGPGSGTQTSTSNSVR